jgi:hypothetical protein
MLSFLSGNIRKFKNGAQFLNEQCKTGKTDLDPQSGIVALVCNPPKESGFKNIVSVLKDGRQLATLKVASRDGGFYVQATTATNKGPKLKEGDLVIWSPLVLAENAQDKFPDKRSGWSGTIRCIIEPELDYSKLTYTIIHEFN